MISLLKVLNELEINSPLIKFIKMNLWGGNMYAININGHIMRFRGTYGVGEIERNFMKFVNHHEIINYINSCRVPYRLSKQHSYIYVNLKYIKLDDNILPINELEINNPSKSFFKFKEEDKYVGKIYTLNDEEFVFNDYSNCYIYIGENLKNVIKLLNKNKIPYYKIHSPDLTVAINIENFNNNLNELEINKPGITQQDCVDLMRKLYELAKSGINDVYNEYWDKLDMNWGYYEFGDYTGPVDFIEQNITTPQLCREFYKDFKETYDKYNKENLNELEINNPGILSKENVIKLCKQLITIYEEIINWEDPEEGITYHYFSPDEEIFINPSIIKYLEKNKELRFKYNNQTVVFYIGNEGLEFEIL